MAQSKLLDNFSVEELKAELEQREKAALPNLPQPNPSPDFSVLIQTVVAGVEDMVKNNWQDEDFKQSVYEAAINAVYGPGFWTWRRAQKW